MVNMNTRELPTVVAIGAGVCDVGAYGVTCSVEATVSSANGRSMFDFTRKPRASCSKPGDNEKFVRRRSGCEGGEQWTHTHGRPQALGLASRRKAPARPATERLTKRVSVEECAAPATSGPGAAPSFRPAPAA